MAKAIVIRDVDKGWNRIRTELRKLDIAIDAGYFPGMLHRKVRRGGVVTSRSGNLPTMASVAAAHVFGVPSKNIPPRDFMRLAVAKNSSKWFRVAERELGRVIDRRKRARSVGNVIGLEMVGGIKEAITEGPFAPNAEATKERKGSSRPLIDTAAMRNSTTHRIKRGVKRGFGGGLGRGL